MYGKLMSINDDLMWKYYVFLTDLRQSEVDALQAEVADGKLHPMQAKKNLARSIVSGFHGEAAALVADENWALEVQQGHFSEKAEEIHIDWERLVVAPQPLLEQLRANPTLPFHINIAKLLVALGICESRTKGETQADAGVTINGVQRKVRIMEVQRPCRLAVKVGKRQKIAVIESTAFVDPTLPSGGWIGRV
jgi:tyrosyl-tRNA synthetase